jgi:uncharacterized membrane protein
LPCHTLTEAFVGKRHSAGVESTAAVFHHPIHPMVIAFPVATLMAVPLADMAAKATKDPFWRRAARWLLVGGLVSGAAASAVGLVDYLAIKEVRRLPSAHVHAGGNVLALALAAANLLRRPADDSEDPQAMELSLSLLTVGLLGATAWLGGELSYRHGVGVIAADSPTASEDIGRLLALAA